MSPQVTYATQHSNVTPDKFPRIKEAMNSGVPTHYDGGAPPIPRQRGLPYHPNNAERFQYIDQKLWQDAYAEYRLVLAAETIADSARIAETPTTTVARNPDRTVSADRRIIEDFRRINIYFPTGQCYNVQVPTNADIVRMITQVQKKCPPLPVMLTKRDISSAFRLLKLRPSLSMLMFAEFHGRFFDPKYYVVLYYRSMPFGWGGSQAFFATLGDAVTVIHGASGMRRPLWNFRFSFKSRLYVGDGVFVEMSNRRRQNESTWIWGIITVGFLVPLALNKKKLEEAGQWPTTPIILGLVYGDESITEPLHE